jgi:serine/threonine-protein kinase
MLCPSCRAENDDDARLCIACRTPLRVVSAGSVVGSRYEVLQTLGRGGMGTVYRAHDRVLDETVALKILRADVAGTPGMAARFRSEIKLARRVSHWNVCRIYEYGEDAGLQFISMELVEGSNLKDQLAREGPPAVERAFELAVQVAEGLEAVHKAGIVHRDLKTPNIMVDEKGVVRVMDFGIARAAAPEGGPEAVTGYVLGSPEYMSPEQARGRAADFRSDVYSLGIVVFEIFSGRVPFRADTPVATLLMHIENQPPLQGPDAPPLPAALVPVLARALAKDPDARHASAREAATALREAAAAAVGRVPTQPLARPRARERGARHGAAAMAIAALVLAAGAVALWRSQRADVRPPADPVSEPSVAASPSPTPTPSYGFADEGPSPTPSLAPPTPRATPTTSPTREATPPSQVVTTPPPPTPLPATPVPAVEATPIPTPSARPPEPSPGTLLVVVRPWADVTVDGVVMGQTPLKQFPLTPGPHDVVLSNSDFQPFRRRVIIRSGQTFRLTVDLANEGVRRR